MPLGSHALHVGCCSAPLCASNRSPIVHIHPFARLLVQTHTHPLCALSLLVSRVGAADDITIAIRPLVLLPPHDLYSSIKRSATRNHLGVFVPKKQPVAVLLESSTPVYHLTLQCSQRFLIELSTFIPRTCCRAAATTTAGAADDRPVRELRILGTAGGNIDEESARVCVCCKVAERAAAAADGRRDSARRLVLRSDMRMHRRMHALLVIMMSCEWKERSGKDVPGEVRVWW